MPPVATRGPRFHPSKDARPKVLVMYSYSESAEEVAKAIRDHVASEYPFCNTLPARRYTWHSGNHYDLIIIVYSNEEGWDFRKQLLEKLNKWAPAEQRLCPVESYPAWKKRFCNRFKMRHQYLSETVEAALSVLNL